MILVMENVNQKQSIEQPAIEKLVKLGNDLGIGPLELHEPDRRRLNDEPDSSVRCRGRLVQVEETSVWDGLTDEEQGETAKAWKMSAKLKDSLDRALRGICTGIVSVRLDQVPDSNAKMKEAVAAIVERVKLLNAEKPLDPFDTRTHAVEVELLGGTQPPDVWLSDTVAVPDQEVLEAAVRTAIERKKGHKHASPENWLLLSDCTLSGLDSGEIDVDRLRKSVAPALVETTWNRVYILIGSATTQPVLLELTDTPTP